MGRRICVGWPESSCKPAFPRAFPLHVREWQKYHVGGSAKPTVNLQRYVVARARAGKFARLQVVTQAASNGDSSVAFPGAGDGLRAGLFKPSDHCQRNSSLCVQFLRMSKASHMVHWTWAAISSAVGERSCSPLQRDVRLCIIFLGERLAAVNKPIALSPGSERRVEQI